MIWRFETAMPPGECVRAFAEAIGTGGCWRVMVSGDNRKALAGRAAVSAVRSPLSFTTSVSDRGTTCAMALTGMTTPALFLTADGRFLRAAVSRVAHRLRRGAPAVPDKDGAEAKRGLVAASA